MNPDHADWGSIVRLITDPSTQRPTSKCTKKNRQRLPAKIMDARKANSNAGRSAMINAGQVGQPAYSRPNGEWAGYRPAGQLDP
ncbi:hypothetical protein [Pandoravirus japonicus]|uniref:Uncharacterized protein n=1 Tax=Pandoravirus japonicus TaxID=2823154 RepID=A0A811BPA9_9VIRU|nr:hypothetical protein [Pandoravirus japonicus]